MDGNSSAEPDNEQLTIQANESADLVVPESGESVDTPATTLVEVSPGIAMVFGEVPAGLELVSFGLIPSSEVTRVSNALAAIGNAATVSGNIAHAFESAKGLYRLADQSMSLLESGAKLASKDGAFLGTILKNGFHAQARFIPATVTKAQLGASIGPALAMMALQAKLEEVSDLVKLNLVVTTQVLETIRQEQWSNLKGLTETIHNTYARALDLENVTETLWEQIAGTRSSLLSQRHLYWGNVQKHAQKIALLKGAERRQYLELNGEAVFFDAQALLHILRANTEYQLVWAAWARAKSDQDPNELLLANKVTKEVHDDFDSMRMEVVDLIHSLTRELSLIAELPGRAMLPLTQKRKDSKAAKLTCKQLLDAITPLADQSYGAGNVVGIPKTLVSRKNDSDLDSHLRSLRWFLEKGEILKGLALPDAAGSRDDVNSMRSVISRQVGNTVGGAVDGTLGAFKRINRGKESNQVDSKPFAVITDRRVIAASTQGLLEQDSVDIEFPLSDIRYVRLTGEYDSKAPATIDVILPTWDFQIVFQAGSDSTEIRNFTELLAKQMNIPDAERNSFGVPLLPAGESSKDVEAPLEMG